MATKNSARPRFGLPTKKVSRCRSFHFRYLELCRAKNIAPLHEVRGKNNSNQILDFFGDKISVTDWLQIMEALYYDQVLQTLAIRMRRCVGYVLDQLDTENKAKLYRQKPVIYTKYVFTGVIEGVANCVEFNKNLNILCLEGLPLNDKYIECVAKALSSNENIKEISFERSNLCDNGCETICNTIKYLDNVEKLNLSECGLTTKGAEYVADMMKIQKISRYSEGWQKSLRYRCFDPESIKGLRWIALARNPKIGDDGLKAIIEVLKEDCWIKFLDMENCSLTDRSANAILDCLELNNNLVDFNLRGNPDISKFLLRSIREHFGKDELDKNLFELQHDLENGMKGDKKNLKSTKTSVTLLKEKLKTLEEQLEFERVLRKKAEGLNEKLNQQILSYERQLQEEEEAAEAAVIKQSIPDGYVVVKSESLQSIIRERNEYQERARDTCSSRNNTPRLVINTVDREKNVVQIAPVNIPSPSRTSAHLELEIPTVLPSSSHKDTRKPIKVRKVKSEMKYVEPLAKEPSKKKESKSDHEYANEYDFNLSHIVFETNIGDSKTHDTSGRQKSSMRPTKGECKKSTPKHIEIDDLNLMSTRTYHTEFESSDSATLRNNNNNFYDMKVFIKNKNNQSKRHRTAASHKERHTYIESECESAIRKSTKAILNEMRHAKESAKSTNSASTYFLGIDEED